MAHNHDEHGHSHGHHHHDHHHSHNHLATSADGHLKRAFILGIWLNVAYVVIEGVFGLLSDSMGLLSDAGHNLSDVASLIIALIAFRAARRKPNDRYTYGYRKATVNASVVNAVILYVAVALILIESVDKLLHPTAVNGGVIAWVAGAGVLVNGFTAWLFLKDSRHDLNVKGAYMHMAADTLVSVGVVVSGIVIYFTGWTVIDPVIGILIAVLIAIGSFSLLRESLRLALDGVPSSIDMSQIREAISAVETVRSFHHLHVWAISTTEAAMTVHVVIDDASDVNAAIDGVREAVRQLGVVHSTIEAETAGIECRCGGCGCDAD